MKISQIIQETSTTAGSVAPVEHGFVKMQTRNPSVYGGKKVGNLLKGKKTNKAFANSVNESAELSEADLSEQDLIVVPGQGRKSKTGFISHDKDRTDHEVEMAISDLFQSGKNAEKIYNMISSISEDEGLEGWVQEKIIKANDYLNTVREYLEGKQLKGATESLGTTGAMTNGEMGEDIAEASLAQMRDYFSQEDSKVSRDYGTPVRKQPQIGIPPRIQALVNKMHQGGNITPVEREYLRQFQERTKMDVGIKEGAKVDRMVKHVAQSEKKLGHSKKEAENIAWATANKRGMLDNKNKK